MIFIDLLKWIIASWLTLAMIKIVLVWGQTLDFAQCYAKVFKAEYSNKLIFDIVLSTPIIIIITTPILFLSEGWKFFFLYNREDILKYMKDIRDDMP